MKSKKLLSIILALAMMFSVLPASTILVYADEITETISADTTWNDGYTVGGVTISGGTVTINGDVGITAAITIKGNVTFTGGGTLNRMSTSGNLIKVESGSLTLDNVTIDGNNVKAQGDGTATAIYITGGTVIMNNGAKITNHKKSSSYCNGGAIYMSGGNFKMNGGTISGCETSEYGGAVYLYGGSFEMNNGTVENNKTTTSTLYGGGAFYVRGATLTINGGLIQNNSSDCGGAIYNSAYGTTIINGGVIKNNTAVGTRQNGAAIFHSCRNSKKGATLRIGGNANIDVGNDIYLMSNTIATKYVEITSSIKNPLILTVEGESEGRVIADAADGVVLTYNDMAKIRLSNSSYALKLEDNKIKLTQTSSEVTTFPVYLGYDANNGTNAPDGSSAEIVAGNSATFTISDSVPTRTGYNFLGWATDKDATSAQYRSGGSITISSNTTLYAVWKKISTFETNEFTQPLTITGWTYGDEPNAPTAEAKYGTIKYTYSNTADGTYTEKVPTNAGTHYVKATVEATADYSGLESNAFEFTILPKTINSAIILTAPVKNKVPQTEMETNEYTATVAWSPEVTDKFGYSTVYTATITITPKANYTVKGIAENGYTVSGAQTVTNEADSATITAVYAATGSKSSGGSGRTKRYTVSFNTNGGNKITSQTVAKDNSAKEPTAPIKENFEFAGWYTDKELTTKYDFTEKVTKSFTLYAKWTEQKQENGGSEDVINNNSGNENKESSNTIVLTIDEHDALVYGTTKTNDVAPKVVNDRTMLPARFVAENLGATVEWDGEKQLVTITGKNEKQEDVTILITIGSDYAKVNGEDIKLDSPAFVENDRTYTPIRFISENLGATVEWNETEQTVTIQRVK